MQIYKVQCMLFVLHYVTENMKVKKYLLISAFTVDLNFTSNVYYSNFEICKN